MEVFIRTLVNSIYKFYEYYLSHFSWNLNIAILFAYTDSHKIIHICNINLCFSFLYNVILIYLMIRKL